ncbi:putative transport protein [Actinobacillus pleuropneumoniae]|uniref:DMT family transporter n=1 Tax=Actinobacillus pleuropneumoniae TaxID=715 RepID=UPI0001E4A4A0|nr:DMT family transporter [Actinobacillus pleuropneumoniae]EFM88925.1 Permease of the drug/metabolite transporter (DMT) superfamily, conserved membrane protein [Actinobacillus pleuropneumoniae serovar 4 str. M62]MBT9318820.1 DMT family transporter [Actinobacillus pleuropneumoniae]MBT9343488.1 DMT family transporter [Actinobacillus pleuropneumoniae]SQF65863.1 putative transport protein [Actinobacillus pleuropneumoniae]
MWGFFLPFFQPYQKSMKQQPLLGFLFSLIAIFMWGMLPLAIKQVLKSLDSQTIVWFRFLVATLGVFAILAFAKKLPNLTAFFRQYHRLWLIGVIGLSCNFFLFNLALNYIPAATSQILSPLSSFVMIILGVVLFKETIGIHQKIGFVLVIVGLVMFFNNRFADLIAMNSYAFGVLLGISASLIWIGYSLSQKIMLAHFSSQQILLLIYFGCALVFTPFAHMGELAKLNLTTWGWLGFCGINTVIAYGCYAEALNRWEVSKVSLMMTQIPILTIMLTALSHTIAPDLFEAPDLNGLSYIGAITVVSGAMLSAVGHKLFYRNQLRKKLDKK